MKIKRCHAAGALLSALLLAACYHYHVKAVLLEPRVRRVPTCVAAVAVFEAPTDVRAAYTAVARISISAVPDMKVTPESEILAERKKAAAVGANGLIIGNPVDRQIAIYIPFDSARVRVACASVGASP